MIYLEMSRDIDHGGGNWCFPNCIWAPNEKRGGGSWPFWSKIMGVREGDIVVHLRGINPDARFVGFSYASGDGYITSQKPPLAKGWSYSNKFYRANLEGFTPFYNPINLLDIFGSRKNELEKYLEKHKNIPEQGKNIFYVEQSGKLQCLNGAYLSDIDELLLFALFGSSDSLHTSLNEPPIITIQTSTQISTIRTRLGHSKFSLEVKKHYKYQCCFPGCSVDDPRFLVASHIARWTDNESLRGDLRNGLCFCLMHDKAFENGVFTLDDDFRIFANPLEKENKSLIIKEIIHHHGESIKIIEIKPSLNALHEHRERVDIQIK